MKLKNIVVATIALLVLSGGSATFASYPESVEGNYPEKESFYLEIENLSSFYETRFMSGWHTAAMVPNSVNVHMTRNGRFYSGVIFRNGRQIVTDQSGMWGAIFSGTLSFTGAVMRSENLEDQIELIYQVPMFSRFAEGEEIELLPAME